MTYSKARSSRLLVYFNFYDFFWSQNYNSPFEKEVSKPVRKRKYTQFGQNTEFRNVKVSGTYAYRRTLMG